MKMKKENKVLVMIWDTRSGDFVKTAFYTDISIKQALINAVYQLKGNFNTWEYPTELDGIYKSKVVKDRLLFDVSENVTLVAQRA